MVSGNVGQEHEAVEAAAAAQRSAVAPTRPSEAVIARTVPFTFEP